MERFRPQLRYANVISTIAVFVALGGGAYAAVTSIPGPDGVIHGCFKHKGGALRLLPAGRRCAKRERAIAFNQRGRPGPAGPTGPTRFVRGPKGLQGLPGPRGEAGAKGGPAGPAAMSLNKSVAKEAGVVTLAEPGLGLRVSGECLGASKELVLKIEAPTSKKLQLIGMRTQEGTTSRVEFAGVESVTARGHTEVAFEAIAQDQAVGKFARIDVDGLMPEGCTFSGMITPSG